MESDMWWWRGRGGTQQLPLILRTPAQINLSPITADRKAHVAQNTDECRIFDIFPPSFVLASLKHTGFEINGLNCRLSALIMSTSLLWEGNKSQKKIFEVNRKESDCTSINLDLSLCGQVFYLLTCRLYSINEKLGTVTMRQSLNKQDTNYLQRVPGSQIEGKDLQSKIKLYDRGDTSVAFGL